MTKGEPPRSGRWARFASVQLSPCHVSKVSPTQYDGRWARTCSTSVFPRPPRSAVLRLSAKPR